MSPDPASTAPNPLRLQLCPRCAYCLQGLPEEGICPECGQRYNQSAVILYGWAVGSGANLGNCTPRAFVGWSIFYGISILIAWQILMLTSSIGQLIYFVSTVIPIPALLSQRYSTPHPGLVQVFLSERGCGQRGDLSGRSVWKDFGVIASILMVAAFMAEVVYLSWTRWMVRLLLGTVIGIVATYASFHWARRRRKSAAPAAPRPLLERLTPWPQIREAIFTPTRAGRCHLRLGAPRPWRLDIQPVDAEILCTDEQAQALRQRLNQWLENAGCPPLRVS